jgi:alpha-galactosidase
MRTLVASMFLLGSALCAADLSGTWMQEMAGRGGGQPRRTYYYFNVQGDTFTGRMVSTNGMSEITNGKIDGNAITFDSKNSFQDNPQQMRGELNGDDLTISGIGGRGRGGPGGPLPGGAPAARGGAPGAAGRGPGGPGGRGNFTPPVYKKIAADMKIPADMLPTHKKLPPVTSSLPYNGLAKTPPMGWNSWNKFRAQVEDKNVREMADAIVSSGMRDAGYIYVNIDDTWQGQRDAQGVLQPNEKFPDMKGLADYVHSKGLKLGIYSSPGRLTCASYNGSYGHEELDAKTYAAWGIDYLKYDWCSAPGVYTKEEHEPAYYLMGKALQATRRPIVYSLCQYGMLDVGEWGTKVGGNLWRTTGDISDRWDSMVRIGFDQQIGREKYAGPGHWNDPDMLEIGNGGMTDTEYRTHMSLWSILAAPLLAGNDIRTMTDATKEILMNKEVIAVDQDKKGVQGTRVRKDGDLEVWSKQLDQGVAVGLFNRGAEPAKISVKWTEVGIKKNNPKVRDLWAHKDLTAATEYTAEVPSHGVVMLRVQ